MKNFIEVKVPPVDKIVGKFIGIVRDNCSSEVNVAFVKYGYKKENHNRIAYRIMSGSDKGKSFEGEYKKQGVFSFDTEDQCRKHFDIVD